LKRAFAKQNRLENEAQRMSRATGVVECGDMSRCESADVSAHSKIQASKFARTFLCRAMLSRGAKGRQTDEIKELSRFGQFSCNGKTGSHDFNHGLGGWWIILALFTSFETR
jgi:hypothetical protein